VFALHPLQVEAVAWVSGLKDVLSGFLSLAAIWLYLRGLDAREAAPRSRMRSRPSRSSWPSRQAGGGDRPSRRVGAARVGARPLAARSHAYRCGLVRSVAGRGGDSARITQNVQGGVATPLWARPFLAGDSLAFYLTSSSFHFTSESTTAVDPSPGSAIRGSISRGSAGGVAGRHSGGSGSSAPYYWAGGPGVRRRAHTGPRLRPFGYQFISQVADHYVYLSMLGAALAVAWLISRRPTATSIAAGLPRRVRPRCSFDGTGERLAKRLHALRACDRGQPGQLARLVSPRLRAARGRTRCGRDQLPRDCDPARPRITGKRAGTWAAILLSLGEKDQAIVEMRRSLAIRSALAADRRVDFFGRPGGARRRPGVAGALRRSRSRVSHLRSCFGAGPAGVARQAPSSSTAAPCSVGTDDTA
jgi:hypothetical protein